MRSATRSAPAAASGGSSPRRSSRTSPRTAYISDRRKGILAIETLEQLLQCASIAADKKAVHLRALDVRELAGYTNYFLICSGASDRQVTAIAETIHEMMKHRGVYPIGTEGVTDGRWALIDYGDIVVHVFLDSVREFYNFDRLWAAAPEVPLPESP